MNKTKKSRFLLNALLTLCAGGLAVGSAEARPANENGGGESVIRVAQAGPGAMPQRRSRRAWESDDPAAEALLKAAYEGDLEALKAALAKGTPVNVKNFANEHSPLHLVTVKADNPAHLEVARELIKAGADVNVSDSKGRTPLIELSRFDTGADMAKLLIDAGANVNARMADGTTAIERTCMEGRASKILNLLIAAKADVNAQDRAIGWSPLHYATWHGHAEQVQALIKAGADVNIGMKPAQRRGNEEDAPCFDGKSGDITCGGTTPLMLAAAKGQKEVAKLLIDAKADVNRADENGWTPLLVAVDQENAKLVAMLLLAKANANQASKDGTLPLLLAAQGNTPDVVKALLAAKADVNAKSKDPNILGMTALHLAAQRGNPEIVKVLLKAGADIHATVDRNAKAYNGLLPLDMASNDEVEAILEAPGQYQ